MGKDRWIFQPINEWVQLLHTFNWYTFTLINIEYEDDVFTGGYEFTFILLGLGLRIRYNTDEAFEKFEEWTKEPEPLTKQEEFIEYLEAHPEERLWQALYNFTGAKTILLDGADPFYKQ